MFGLKTTPTFEKSVKQLDPPIRERIFSKLEHLAQNPELAKPVKYLPEEYNNLKKYRIGDWRVFFWLDLDSEMIILYEVRHRSSAYERFK